MVHKCLQRLVYMYKPVLCVLESQNFVLFMTEFLSCEKLITELISGGLLCSNVSLVSTINIFITFTITYSTE